MKSDLGTPARIVIVEDEFLIRLTLSEALTDEGFVVVDCESGDEALPILQSDRSIRLLLTDIQLPGGLDGFALAETIRQTVPSLPVIFMTGRPNSGPDTPDSKLDIFISKPYTLAEVCDAARRLTATTVS